MAATKKLRWTDNEKKVLMAIGDKGEHKRCHDIQHNDTQHNNTQHNDTQQNDTQRNGLVCDTQHN